MEGIITYFMGSHNGSSPSLAFQELASMVCLSIPRHTQLRVFMSLFMTKALCFWLYASLFRAERLFSFQ